MIMNKLAVPAGAVALVLALGPAAAQEKVVNVYNWSDYIDESILEDFQKETGIRGSEEHTSELQSLMRSSYAVSCLKKKKKNYTKNTLKLQKQNTRKKFIQIKRQIQLTKA